MKKEYSNGEITVIWQPSLCIHSAVCFHKLPSVFKPRDRPWVQMQNSDTASIRETVLACPSGALSLKQEATKENYLAPMTTDTLHSVKIIDKGPLRITNPCVITLPDGSVVDKPNGASFCRCGASKNKPFCDGSHKTNGWESEL